MKKKAVEILYKTKGDFSPNGLQKVFCSFHPADISHMQNATEDILSVANCAIFYHPSDIDKDAVDLDDYTMKLLEMKLLVVIVSTNFLKEDSFAKNWEYGFAIEHNIPVLPIAVEYDIEAYFANEMNRIRKGYGDIQLLRTKVRDKTEIAYQQKLYRDLSSILIDDNEIHKIRKAFSGQIFLSYRKKDRKYAHELMRTIHDIPSLRNVSIWYDEFISSGEKWSDKIGDVLKQSDVFLLMVTPSIIEPDNYVIKEEYPAAQKHEKVIIPAIKAASTGKTIDEEKLRQLFPGLKIYIDGDNAKELEEALSDLSDKSDNSPEKDYLIGLAFFNGIEVEKNSEKAVTLIIASAKREFPAAINKLAEMYWNGDGIAVNYENSILWRKKLVGIYNKKLADITNEDEVLGYVQALEKLTACLYELSSFRDSMYYGKQLVSALEQIISFTEADRFFEYVSTAYDLCGKNARRLGLFDEALEYAKKYLDFMRERYQERKNTNNYHNLSVAYERLGDVYYAIGAYEDCKEWYQKAVEIDREIDDQLKTIDSAFALSASLLVLGDIYIRSQEYQISERYYSEALSLRRRILDAYDSDEHRIQYGEALISQGTILTLTKSFAAAKALFREAEIIFKNIAEESGTIESQHTYSLVLNRLGKICELEHDYEGALTYYKKALVRREKILRHIRTNETIYEYALTEYFIAEACRQKSESANAKRSYEKVVTLLLPVLVNDRKGDCHQIFYEAAFERFKLDTYSGKKYLRFAIEALEWLVEQKSYNKQYQKQCELCKKMYMRCYPN